MRSILLFLMIVLGANGPVYGTGVLKGTTKDHQGQPIAFASVVVLQDNVQKAAVSSDIDGNYEIHNMKPGSYVVKFLSIGYSTAVYTNIIIQEAKVTILDAEMDLAVSLLDCIQISTSRPIVQKKDKTVTITSNSNIVSSSGVNSNDGTINNTRGSRSGNTVFIDGVRLRGVNDLQQNLMIIPGILSSTDDPLSSTEPNNDQYEAFVENRFVSPFAAPLSTFSIDVDKASYTNIRRILNSGMLPDRNAVRIEEMINYFHYDYPQPTGADPFSINLEMSACPWNKKNHLVLVGLQGKEYAREELPPSNLVFLIDVSGSMSSPNKLPLVKTALKALVKELRKEDKVSIVVYAGNAGVVLEPTAGDQKDKINEALNKLSAGGSTAGGEGIVLAYRLAEEHLLKKGNNRVVLATDGDFNVGVSSDDGLVKLIEDKRKLGVYLTVLGFGMGNYKDTKMEKLSNKGNGNYAYIDSQQEAENILVSQFAGTMHAIAKDVKLQLEFNPAIVKSYRLIGYENRLLEDWEFDDDTRDAGDLGAGHTVTALYEVALYDAPLTRRSDDALKYQETGFSAAATSDEILTIKFRYKPPREETSQLITQVLKNEKKQFEDASDNLRFASAVAGFGMILRKSEFYNDLTMEVVLEIAKNSKGKDDDGYKSEFIRLVRTAQSLM